VIGIGLDAVDIARFRTIIARRPGVIDRVFTDGERTLLVERSDPVPGLAGRFAAKEAAMKALGVGIGAVDFRDLEVVTAASGAPLVRMHGRATIVAANLGVTAMLVSITHTDDLAQAIVFAQ
jgi:holo-[acyl-carrier protein] synthase